MYFICRIKALVVLLIFSVTALFASENSASERWAHLELGAGNYGQDGHTQASQMKTVLMKLMASSEKNYIDGLEEVGRGDYNPLEQYAVLFWTLEELVKRQGPVGVFHVNDLYEEYALFAAEKLRDYVASKGYDLIEVDVVPGDYQLIDAKQALAAYGITKYSSVHLKNPEVSFYYERLDADQLFASQESRAETRQLLKQLAGLSEEGVLLFILNHPDFIPLEEKRDYMDKGLFYHLSTNWPPAPYVFPEGMVYPQERASGIVFHIKP